MNKKQVMQLIKDGMENVGDTKCIVDYNEKSKLFDIYLDLDGLEYKEEEPNFSFTEDGTLITGGDEEWLDWVMLKKLSTLSSLINKHYDKNVKKYDLSFNVTTLNNEEQKFLKGHSLDYFVSKYDSLTIEVLVDDKTFKEIQEMNIPFTLEQSNIE